MTIHSPVCSDIDMLPKRMELCDCQKVAELEALCFHEPWSAHALELLTGEQAAGEVLYDGDSLAAYGGIFWAPEEGQITNIAVHPAHRRKGYGRKILAALLQDAKEKDCLRVVLEVRASNAGAIRLYESEGFCKVGERKNFYKNPLENAFIYEKDLT